MNNVITISASTEINDPKLYSIALRIKRQLELAAEKVAANFTDPKRFPLCADPKSYERILATRFMALPDARKKSASVRAMKRIDTSRELRIRRFGDLTAVDLTKEVAVEAQAQALVFPANLKLSPSHLAGLASGAVAPFGQPQGAAPAPTLTGSAPKATKLALRLHRVRCIDETNGAFGAEIGDDEILMGGTAVDTVGTTTKISSFLVGDYFDDGEVKDYSPAKTLAKFDLTKGDKYPKYYFATLTLAERDNGGFPEFLSDLLESVKKGVASAIGSAAGAAFGSLAGPLGAIIGAAVGALLGWIVEVIKEAWEDDVFPVKTVSCTVTGPNATFAGGKKDSEDTILKYSAHGGEYWVRVDWQLLA